MKIDMIIFENNKQGKGYEPEKYHFNGNWALETMINKLLTKYYGTKIAEKVDDFLKERIKKEGE